MVLEGVSAAGDVNGDGYDEILVGAYGYDTNDYGKVYLYLGSKNGLLTDYSWSYVGDSVGDCLGEIVASCGDINGDGFNDIVVAAPAHNSNLGIAYLFLGSSDGILTYPSGWVPGENSGDCYGSALTYGDVDGDGYDNAIIGARNYDSGRGKAYLYA